MTGADHFKQAESLIDELTSVLRPSATPTAGEVALIHAIVARAQVHASLAVADAVAAIAGKHSTGIGDR